jgi:hypothetical protein
MSDSPWEDAISSLSLNDNYALARLIIGREMSDNILKAGDERVYEVAVDLRRVLAGMLTPFVVADSASRFLSDVADAGIKIGETGFYDVAREVATLCRHTFLLFPAPFGVSEMGDPIDEAVALYVEEDVLRDLVAVAMLHGLFTSNPASVTAVASILPDDVGEKVYRWLRVFPPLLAAFEKEMEGRGDDE